MDQKRTGEWSRGHSPLGRPGKVSNGKTFDPARKSTENHQGKKTVASAKDRQIGKATGGGRVHTKERSSKVTVSIKKQSREKVKKPVRSLRNAGRLQAAKEKGPTKHSAPSVQNCFACGEGGGVNGSEKGEKGIKSQRASLKDSRSRIT